MDINQIVAALTAERNKLDQAINALEGVNVPSTPGRGRPPNSHASQLASSKRTMSPAARKLISIAQKARWAKQKGASVSKRAAAPAKKAAARKPMSPAMKKKMSALMKARWAKAKKSGAKAL
jgi:hypothetical protein